MAISVLTGDVLMNVFFFFFNDTATTEIYTLSLHDALPILGQLRLRLLGHLEMVFQRRQRLAGPRSEEHTSELQSPCNLVCRLLLVKKNSTGLESNRLPHCLHRRETIYRLHTSRTYQQNNRSHECLLRAFSGLHCRKGSPLGLSKVQECQQRNRHPDEVRRRGHGHRKMLRRSPPESNTNARLGK